MSFFFFWFLGPSFVIVCVWGGDFANGGWVDGRYAESDGIVYKI